MKIKFGINNWFLKLLVLEVSKKSYMNYTFLKVFGANN